MTLLPLAIFDGGFNAGLAHYIRNWSISNKQYMDLMVLGGPYGHSLLALARILLPHSLPPVSEMLRPYLFFTLILFALLALFILKEKVLWKKIALLVIAIDLLPYTSSDYKLIHLLIPLFLYVNTSTKSRLDVVYAVLFGLLLIPKDYAYLTGDPYLRLSYVLNPLLMLALAFCIVGSGLMKAKARTLVANKVNPEPTFFPRLTEDQSHSSGAAVLDCEKA